MAPTINDATRRNPETVAIEAEFRESDFDFYEVKVYNSTGDYLRDRVVRTLTFVFVFEIEFN